VVVLGITYLPSLSIGVLAKIKALRTPVVNSVTSPVPGRPL
jgi:hypothetical protein